MCNTVQVIKYYQQSAIHSTLQQVLVDQGGQYFPLCPHLQHHPVLQHLLDIKKRKWIQSNLKLPRPLSSHHMALCGEYIYICDYYSYGYFWRMASLTNNVVHHLEELENVPWNSSLLQYSTLPVIIGSKGIFIFEKKWTQISKETSYHFNCTASLNETILFSPLEEKTLEENNIRQKLYSTILQLRLVTYLITKH